MQMMTLRSRSHKGATPSARVPQLSATSMFVMPTWPLQLAPPSSAHGAPPPGARTQQWTHWRSVVNSLDVESVLLSRAPNLKSALARGARDTAKPASGHLSGGSSRGRSPKEGRSNDGGSPRLPTLHLTVLEKFG